MKAYKIGLLLLFIFFVSGCKVQQHIQQHLDQSRSQFEVAPFEVVLPAHSVQSINELPGHIRLVTAAIVERLRKEPTLLKNVNFSQTGRHFVAEPYFDYEAFSVTSVTIQDFQATEVSRNNYFCVLEGYLTFDDPFSRRAVNYFKAEYRLNTDGIEIARSIVLPTPPVFPEVQAYIISSQEFAIALKSADDFYAFYTEVATRALRMTPTQEEVRQREELMKMTFFQRIRNAPRRERNDLIMTVFVMDRLTPEAELDVVVSRTLHERNSMVVPSYLNYDGWRVAMFGGNFALDRDVFYTKVYYKPNSSILPDNKDQVLIGLFKTEKNYQGQLDQTLEAQQTHEGPLAQGRVFLDTSNRSDATVIQTRLAELGFYNMAIDGLWGPGSRSALQNFQMASGLGANGVWDMGTQMRLFAGTGR
ncbi:peptidoglycan-binding domain-containing protein [Desulfonatronovibrio hydrogenovorans]|uniref:peptidoglycan-binding domain-containing protein n=1 Tax=Desulfonatronovibrio hydrogenovorans TaxID=53245 RepID=UPI00048B80A9|nr:peptidoglycan-binding domain-containing protein [Desulfonatronovibrio hydrogenovorans]